MSEGKSPALHFLFAAFWAFLCIASGWFLGRLSVSNWWIQWIPVLCLAVAAFFALLAIWREFVDGMERMAWAWRASDAAKAKVGPKPNVPPDLTEEFLIEFLSACNDTYLVPVREYTDGKQRDLARAVTLWCIEQGYADPAVGNIPARWKSGFTPWGVARANGITLKDPPPPLLDASGVA